MVRLSHRRGGGLDQDCQSLRGAGWTVYVRRVGTVLRGSCQVSDPPPLRLCGIAGRGRDGTDSTGPDRFDSLGLILVRGTIFTIAKLSHIKYRKEKDLESSCPWDRTLRLS